MYTQRERHTDPSSSTRISACSLETESKFILMSQFAALIEAFIGKRIAQWTAQYMLPQACKLHPQIMFSSDYSIRSRHTHARGTLANIHHTAPQTLGHLGAPLWGDFTDQRHRGVRSTACKLSLHFISSYNYNSAYPSVAAGIHTQKHRACGCIPTKDVAAFDQREALG
jgi:hypothetical protein